MDLYICSTCGHEVLSAEQPGNIKWTDGHVCHFQKATKEEVHPDRGRPVRSREATK